MTAEIPQFTKEQVFQSERREGFSHPVLDVIDQHLPKINWLAEVYVAIVDDQERQRYVRQNYGFLADALVEAGSYTLQPLEIVGIWSRAREVFSNYQRYALAGMIAGAYAVQGAEHPAWRRFPRYFQETVGQLPDEVAADKSGLIYVRGRLDQVGKSLDALDFYVYGTREPGMETVGKLVARLIDGDDKEAQAELDRLIARQKEYQTPLLGLVQENWSNGYIALYFPIQNALKALESGVS